MADDRPEVPSDERAAKRRKAHPQQVLCAACGRGDKLDFGADAQPFCYACEPEKDTEELRTAREERRVQAVRKAAMNKGFRVGI